MPSVPARGPVKVLPVTLVSRLSRTTALTRVATSLDFDAVEFAADTRQTDRRTCGQGAARNETDFL